MMGINLHGVVRGAITAIHPDLDAVLYQALDQKNVFGVVTPVYSRLSIKANFQPLDTNTLKHLEAINDTAASEQVFLYSTTPPVSGGGRTPLTRAGDFIEYSGNYWLVTSVIEDWSQDGWANVGVHKQVTPPDFSASEWSDDYVESSK